MPSKLDVGIRRHLYLHLRLCCISAKPYLILPFLHWLSNGLIHDMNRIMPPLLSHVFMVKHICASRNWSLFCFRNSLGNKLSLTRPRYLNPTYNSVQQPQNRGKQTLTHEHVDSIARSILKRDFGYDDFRHEQVRYHIPFSEVTVIDAFLCHRLPPSGLFCKEKMRLLCSLLALASRYAIRYVVIQGALELIQV